MGIGIAQGEIGDGRRRIGESFPADEVAGVEDITDNDSSNGGGQDAEGQTGQEDEHPARPAVWVTPRRRRRRRGHCVFSPTIALELLPTRHRDDGRQPAEARVQPREVCVGPAPNSGAF